MRAKICVLFSFIFVGSTVAQPRSAEWQVGCQENARDGIGRLYQKKKCWVMVSQPSDFASPTANEHGMTGHTLFEIDDQGERILSGTGYLFSCRVGTPKIGVDGRDITKLSHDQKLKAIFAANKVYIDQIGPPPYCGRSAASATTVGAADAYKFMKYRWSLVKGLK